MFFLFLITFPGTIHYADEKPFYPLEVHVNFFPGRSRGHNDLNNPSYEAFHSLFHDCFCYTSILFLIKVISD